MLHELWLNPMAHSLIRNGVTGFCSGIGVDLLLFQSCNSWHEFFDKFDFGVASKRWVTGILFGAIGGGGLGYLFGM